MLRFRLLLLLATLAPGQARADQCAPREVVWLSGPKTGARVPPSIRFRLYIGEGCSSVPEGPPSQFRLLGATGRPLDLRRERWAGYTELVPSTPLSAGVWRLERRHAIDSRRLGPWKRITQVTVKGAPDRRPPVLTGRVETSTRAVWGTNFLSPCEAEEGWELETTFRLQPATDGTTEHRHLVYSLSRREHGKRRFEPVGTFTPRPAGTLVEHRRKEEYGWNRRWEYRICVRDPSGNASCHPNAIVVSAPRRPARPTSAPRSKLDY